jgi:hypothetical protein
VPCRAAGNSQDSVPPRRRAPPKERLLAAEGLSRETSSITAGLPGLAGYDVRVFARLTLGWLLRFIKGRDEGEAEIACGLQQKRESP